MKKSLLLAGVATLVALNANAFEFNPYVSVKYIKADMESSYKVEQIKPGVTIADISESDKNSAYSIAFGTRNQLTKGTLRTELEFQQNGKLKSHLSGTEELNTNTEIKSLMLNTYYEFDTGTKFNPYVSAGLGFAQIETSLKSSYMSMGSEKAENLTWQLGAGVSYNFNEHLSFDTGYRHIDYGDYNNETFINYKTKGEAESDEIYFGIRYAF